MDKKQLVSGDPKEGFKPVVDEIIVEDTLKSDSAINALAAKRGKYLAARMFNMSNALRYVPDTTKFVLFNDTPITTFKQFKEIFDCFVDNFGVKFPNPYANIETVTPNNLAEVVQIFRTFVSNNTVKYDNKQIDVYLNEFAYDEGKPKKTNVWAMGFAGNYLATIEIDNPLTSDNKDYQGLQYKIVHGITLDKTTAEILDYDNTNRYFAYSMKFSNEMANLLIGGSTSPYLSKTNTQSYTPTSSYHPSTKKYVDDAVNSIKINGATTYDASAYIKTNAAYGQSKFNITTDQFTELMNAAKAGSLIYINISGNKILCTTSRMNGDTQVVLAAQNQGYGFVNSAAGVNTTRVTLIVKNTGEVTQYSALANIISTGDGSMCQNDAGGYTGVLSTGVNPKDFTPTHNNHPATKKYVDDAITNIPVNKGVFVIPSVKNNTVITGVTKDDIQNAISNNIPVIIDELYINEYDVLNSVVVSSADNSIAGTLSLNCYGIDKSFNISIILDTLDCSVYETAYSYEDFVGPIPVNGQTYAQYNDLLIAIDANKTIKFTNSAGLYEVEFYANDSNNIRLSLKSHNIYINHTTKIAQVIDVSYANADNVLTRNNTDEYTPTSEYHPSTKKYVDDKVAASPGGSKINVIHSITLLTAEPAEIMNWVLKSDDLVKVRDSAENGTPLFIVNSYADYNMPSLSTPVFFYANGAEGYRFSYVVKNNNNNNLYLYIVSINDMEGTTPYYVTKDLIIINKVVTSSEYDAITTKNTDNILYFITE